MAFRVSSVKEYLSDTVYFSYFVSIFLSFSSGCVSVKMSTLYRRGGAASLYAPESRHFGTLTDPGRLATVKMSTLLIRIARGFSSRTIVVGPRFG